jgi:tRNA-splicing ligase RtcB
VFKHVAVMPDVHFGKGATVGTVVAMRGAVAPSAVGVDIGCGMAAIQTNLDASALPGDLSLLRAAIEKAIPVGFNQHESTLPIVSASRLWSDFKNLTKEVHALEPKARHQGGTLGGGNHFIEVCLDEHSKVWVMLHSGSRNIGKCLAEVHIKMAKGLSHNASIQDKDLSVFLDGTPEMDAYMHDLLWAQSYALLNREAMIGEIEKVLQSVFPGISFSEAINCTHNYVSKENHFGEDVLVTRKGAIRARKGESGIIPGSMGAKSFIVRGLGNPDSFDSASHGAGRKMSRGEAKRRFTLEDVERQTMGVECRKDAGVIDEIPDAYKNIDEVMANQADLVEIVHTLRQVLCVKG